MGLDVLPFRAVNFGILPTDLAVLFLTDEALLQQEPQGQHSVIVVDGILQVHVGFLPL